MVALATPKLASVIPLNLARPMLLSAQDCESRGDLIGCGVRLREALRRQLHSMCLYHAVRPTGKFSTTPRAMLKALRADGACDEDGAYWVGEIIEIGNTAAHCGRVDRHALRGAMTILHRLIDSNLCGEEFERFPKPASVCDCWDDDDDGANWWKGGVL